MNDARRPDHPLAPAGDDRGGRGRRRRRRARPAGGWSPTADELAKHGDAAAGVEEVGRALPATPTSAWCSAATARSSTRCAASPARGVPVFGVNFGTVGFLAAVERERGRGGDRPGAGRGDRDDRRCPASRSRSAASGGSRLNDVSFSRRPHDRVAELSYKIAGEEVGHVRCDGLVAATPAGSTGYNLANQGPILAWGVKGYVVSYISPHSLTARALVVAPGDVLHVGNAAGREPVDVAVDGGHAGELEPGAALEVGFADDVASLAQLPGTSFYQRIREKFGHLAV